MPLTRKEHGSGDNGDGGNLGTIWKQILIFFCNYAFSVIIKDFNIPVCKMKAAVRNKFSLKEAMSGIIQNILFIGKLEELDLWLQ